MAVITASNLASDQEKFLAARIVENTLNRLVAKSIPDPVELTQGNGTTAYFVRYKRMNIPLTTLTEGTDPSSSTFSLEQLSVSLDQWGDILEVSDIGELSAKHPVMTQMVELLSDNAQRVIDREIQLVWLANTNKQYGDGTVTQRNAITSSMVAKTTSLLKARVTLVDAGATPRTLNDKGPVDNSKVESAADAANFNHNQHYVAICGPQVMADITAEATSSGSWMYVQGYQNKMATYNYEVGTWLGFRWVESNFVPKYRLLGGTTAAVVSGNAFGTDTPVVTAVNGGGALNSATTYFFRVTRIDLLRGFEEDISREHSMASAATGDNESFTFNFTGMTAGYVYNVYFDTVQTGGSGTDATMKLVTGGSKVAVGTTVTVTAVGSGTTAPSSIKVDGTVNGVHPVYIHGKSSCNFVTLQNLQAYITDNTRSTIGNVLRLKRAAGYKFMSKCMMRNATRLLVVEFGSQY